MKEKFNEFLFWGLSGCWTVFGCWIVWVTR
jgi:hypothetical protein